MESHSEKMQKDLDIIESKLNDLEASTQDRSQKSLFGALKSMAETQKHLINEFEHLKKAIDLLTLQVFKMEKRLDS